VVNIFSYTDYREYLNDYFTAQKKKSSHFSHRYLCQKLGLKSSNFMLLVMKGKRNISSEICFKLSTLFKQTQQEAAYFSNMVYFSQTKNYREKDQYWEKMVELRQKTKFGKIAKYQYEYYNNCYTIVVRELVPYLKKPIDFKMLARLVQPPITTVQARQSVKLLLKLGLIEETGTGYIKSDPVVKTEDKVNSLAIYNFHVTMSKVATEKLENCFREERNFSSCTMNVSEEGYKRIVAKVNEFRDEVMSICELYEEADRVYHMNVQLFPVTIKVKKDSER